MDAKTLKEKLNEDLVVRILETIGCNNIKPQGKTIKASNPDGDNASAICVYTDNWHVENFTRPEFNNMKTRDIISLVQFVEKTNFFKATKRICDICEFDFYKKPDNKQKRIHKSDVKFVFEYTGANTINEEDIELTPLPKNILMRFVYLPYHPWIKEDIKASSQHKFKIGMDLETSRISIPIKDEIGSLVGVKGRLLYDTEGVHDKYIYIYPFSSKKVLYGLYQNYNNIIKKDQIIIVESEKSVIKLHGHGYKNAVALSGKTISQTQADKIVATGVNNVVICMDKDVSDTEVQAIADRINKYEKFCDIYVMKDEFDLMQPKESPTDNIETWKALWENIIKLEEL